MVHLFLFLYVCYSTLKFSTITFIKSMHDSELLNLETKLLQRAIVKTNRCAVFAESNQQSLRNLSESYLRLEPRERLQLHRLLYLRDGLGLLGDPMTSIVGIGPIFSFMPSTMSLCYCLSAILYLWINPTYIDSLEYLLNPLNEWERLEDELASIIRNFTESINKYAGFQRTSSLRAQINYCSYSKQYMKMQERKQIKLNHSYYQKILLDIQLGSLVRPTHMKLKFHNFSIIFYRWATIFFYCLSMIVCFILFISMICIQLKNRISHKFNQIECRKWQPNGVPTAKGFLVLPQLTTERERQLYLSYTGTSGELAHIVWLELHEWLTPAIAISVIEIIFFMTTGTKWLILWLGAYIHAQMQRYVWLAELVFQVTKTVDFMCRTFMKTASDKQTFVRDEYYTYIPNAANNLEYKITKLLTICYLNFELFRRQHRRHYKLIRFLFGQSATIAACTLLFVFILQHNVPSSQTPILLLCCTVMVLITNILLLFSSLLVFFHLV